MNKTSRGLGKGLGALLKTDKAVAPAAKPEGQVQEIPVTKITANKQQPRTVFTAEALEELAGSIAQFGVLQPLLLKKTADGYEIVAGERRFRAAKAAGLKTVPAIVRNLSAAETTEIALIENLQREDLNIIEEATAYARLMNEFDLTQEQVSERIGKSRPHIANCLRLLNLPAKGQPLFQMEPQQVISAGGLRRLCASVLPHVGGPPARLVDGRHRSFREDSSAGVRTSGELGVQPLLEPTFRITGGLLQTDGQSRLLQVLSVPVYGCLCWLGAQRGHRPRRFLRRRVPL